MILTVKELAQQYRISGATVYAHWRELGGFKIAGSIRFDGDLIRDRLFQENQEGNQVVLSVYGRRDLPSGGRIPHSAGGTGRGKREQKVTLPRSQNGLW